MTEIFFPQWTHRSPSDGYGGVADLMVKHAHHGGLHLDPNPRGQKAALIFCNPTHLSHFVEKFGRTMKRIAYTMQETTRWPQCIIDSFNDSADMVIVPAQWNRRSLVEQGVCVPVEVVPLGVETDTFQFAPRPDRVDEPFRFITYNAGDTRKGFPLYLEAFAEEFGPYEPVEFIAKTVRWGDRIAPYLATHPGIRLLEMECDKRTLHRMLSNCHCFVFSSRGEGFGLPPLEAMATGLPTIVTKAHAHLDFYDPSRCYGIDAREVPAPAGCLGQTYRGWPPARPEGCWFDPDKDQLKAAMRHVYTHWKEARSVGESAAQWVRQNLAFPHVMQQLGDVIRQYA